jgi:8-oxo-dGTP diphosphatase
MKNTTLCYIEHNGKVLMLFRNKKKKDINEGKWIGIGGKFKENESPEECMLREVYEETGIRLTNWKYRGIVTFVSDSCEGEYMHLFTATSDTDKVCDCKEGTLKWIEKTEILSLNMWEGDRVFLELLDKDERFFSLKLVYKGDKLISTVTN